MKDDLISRQAAIDAADRTDYTGLTVEDVKKVTDEVVKEIKKLQPAQSDNGYSDGFADGYKRGLTDAHEPEPQWIPVTERLPEEDKPVFVYLFYDSPHIAWLSEGLWFTDDFIIDKDDEPTAWMPLPEPYRGDRNEDWR